MAQNLLSPDGLAALAKHVAPDTLFAFDLDGTLAPIVAEYSEAVIDKPTRTVLERLLNLVKVAVITGRSRKDALAILELQPHLLIGNHGAEWPDAEIFHGNGKVNFCLKWREQLHDKLCGSQGIEIEYKGESLSIHYRKTEDHKQAIDLINDEINRLVPAPKIIGGKYVVNLLPVDALTKGLALKAAMNSLGAERAIYFGDDVTDEEVFHLDGIDLLGIHIGEETETAAAYYLSNQSELLGLLNSMAEILESHQEVCNVPNNHRFCKNHKR